MHLWNPNTKSTGRPRELNPGSSDTPSRSVRTVSVTWDTEAGLHECIYCRIFVVCRTVVDWWTICRLMVAWQVPRTLVSHSDMTCTYVVCLFALVMLSFTSSCLTAIWCREPASSDCYNSATSYWGPSYHYVKTPSYCTEQIYWL